jgi:hypothetical protein
MKAYVHMKLLLMAAVLAITALLWPSGANAIDAERLAQIRQTRVERFDKILQMARIQHARIEEWQKQARTHDLQKRAPQKTRSAVAMKD